KRDDQGFAPAFPPSEVDDAVLPARYGTLKAVVVAVGGFGTSAIGEHPPATAVWCRSGDSPPPPSQGSGWGFRRITPSCRAGSVLWWLATRSGIGSPFAPRHGPGGTGLGFGCGGFGWTTVVPNAGGFGRWSA